MKLFPADDGPTDRVVPIMCAQRTVSEQTGGSLRDALHLMRERTLVTPSTLDEIAGLVLDGSLRFDQTED